MQGIITDSFPKIWAGLTEGQQYSLGMALIQEKCTTTRQTIWNWANGKTQPTSQDTKNHIAKIVSKVVGLRVLPDTLFPGK